MAKDENQIPTTPSQAPTAYTLEELLSAAAAFDCKPEVIEGALNYKFKGQKKTFTKAETRSAIEDFKKKEVK